MLGLRLLSFVEVRFCQAMSTSASGASGGASGASAASGAPGASNRVCVDCGCASGKMSLAQGRLPVRDRRCKVCLKRRRKLCADSGSQAAAKAIALIFPNLTAADRALAAQTAHGIVVCCESCAREREPGERKFQRCSGCQFVHYCSRECQVSDWREGHKAMCLSYRRRRGIQPAC